jgi:hypothetical protein
MPSKNKSENKPEKHDEKIKKKEDTKPSPQPDKKPKSEEDEDKTERHERKPSYIERAMITFVKDKLVGGFDALKKPLILPFSVLSIGVLMINFVLAISLAHFDDPNINLWLRRFQLIHLIMAVSLVLFGFVSAIFKNPRVQQIFVLVGMLGSTIAVGIINPDPDLIIFDIFKTIFLIIWILISCTSLYFMFLYLFNGLPGKMITAGKSQDHIFLEPILNFGALITIAFSILLMIKNPVINAYIIGGLGIIAALLVLYFTFRAERNDSNVNYATIIGLYNLYIAYQLSGSIERADNLPNMLTELVLLVFIALYNIKNLTMRLEKMDMKELELEQQFREVFFQKHANIFPKIKNKMGDFSLIIIALGLSIGYFNFVLFSYISPTFPILGGFIDASLGLSVISKRMFSLVSTLLLIGMTIVFFKSPRFRDMVVNKYNLKQAFHIAGDVVRSWGRRLKHKIQSRKEEHEKEEHEKEDDEFIKLTEN